MLKKRNWIKQSVYWIGLGFVMMGGFGAKAEEALPKRIETVSTIINESFQLEMVPGLGTLIRFPCPVERAILGNQNAASIVFNEHFSKEIVVSLVPGTKLATNLIVTCVNNQNPFVFDIHPNDGRHRDVLIIRQQKRKIPKVSPSEAEVRKSASKGKLLIPNKMGGASFKFNNGGK